MLADGFISDGILSPGLASPGRDPPRTLSNPGQSLWNRIMAAYQIDDEGGRGC